MSSSRADRAIEDGWPGCVGIPYPDRLPGAQVVEIDLGSDSRYQVMTRMERPTATMAFFLPTPSGDAPVTLTQERGEHLAQQEAVVVGEVSDDRLFQWGDLGAHAGACHLGQDLRVAFTGRP
jgi:hypothetical protein